MPNDVSTGYNQGHIDLSKAPGADMDWDQLFPNPEIQTATQPQVANGTNPQQQPQATQSNQPFLKAGETVYNTAEDAANGLAHKDAIVAKYRNFLAQNGFDPNALLKDDFQTTRPQVQQPTETIKNSPYKYYGNPNFFDEVAAAAQSRDKAKYEQLMAAHTQEAISATLDPWRATLADTNRFNAIRQVSTEIPEFAKFIQGPEYKKVLDNFPLYGEMTQIGENDPTAARRLPEVYKSIYLIYQGMNQNQAQPQVTATPNTPTVRQQPTLQNSSLTPPAVQTSTQGWADANWRGNKSIGNDARKQLIQDGDNKFNGMRFEDVGL